jgi:hypothetical protein
MKAAGFRTTRTTVDIIKTILEFTNLTQPYRVDDDDATDHQVP